jgi:hypothetical protein
MVHKFHVYARQYTHRICLWLISTTTYRYMREGRFSFTHPAPQNWIEVSGQLHAPTALTSAKRFAYPLTSRQAAPGVGLHGTDKTKKKVSLAGNLITIPQYAGYIIRKLFWESGSSTVSTFSTVYIVLDYDTRVILTIQPPGRTQTQCTASQNSASASTMQCMVFGRWNFQTVDSERVTNAATYLVYLFVSSSVSTVDQVTLKLQANKHPPLLTLHTR